MYRYCSPTLIRLALLGTFPGGEGIRCGGDSGGQGRPPLHSESMAQCNLEERADEGIGPYKRCGDVPGFLKKSEYSVNCLLFRADCARME